MKKKSHIYIMNGTRSKHGHKLLNIKYKTYNDGYMY